jgi:hypothetical protein
MAGLIPETCGPAAAPGTAPGSLPGLSDATGREMDRRRRSRAFIGHYFAIIGYAVLYSWCHFGSHRCATHETSYTGIADPQRGCAGTQSAGHESLAGVGVGDRPFERIESVIGNIQRAVSEPTAKTFHMLQRLRKYLTDVKGRLDSTFACRLEKADESRHIGVGPLNEGGQLACWLFRPIGK